MKFLLGKKIGMTMIIDEQGSTVPVTVVEAGPCTVTQIRSEEVDGYAAVQVGFGDAKKTNKPQTGHFAKAGRNVKHVKESRVSAEDTTPQLGETLDLSQFSIGDKVKISGLTKGHGFTGPVKRYGFKGGPGSHGHPSTRRVGSIGGRFPQRVIKGLRMATRWGNERNTIAGITIVDIISDKNLLLVKGSVPGRRGTLLEIQG